MARPQNPKSCGISSLTSVWNFLFSTLGAGKHRPISTEEALEVLGFKPPYSNFDFGSFTGNDTLIQWFALLCKFFQVKGGKAQILWKPRGKSQTPDSVSEATAHARLIEGLRSDSKAYIYHCWNHYFCPLGFDLTPVHAMDAYAPLSDEMQTETWVIIGEVSKCFPCFHTKRWSDIVTDLTTGYPEFFNIRKSELGVQRKESEIFQEGGAKHGGNLHCLIEFECD
jgi:hypothetical protein